MKTKVIYSNKKDAKEAGIEIATKAKEGFNPKVGIIFSSLGYDREKLLNEIKKESEDYDIVGCTSSAGIITEEGYKIDEEGVSGLMVFEDENLKVACYGLEKKNTARETGRQVAIKALEKSNIDYAPDYFYIAATPNEEDEYIKGIQDVIGRVPCFGGSAADDTYKNNWEVYYNNNIIKEGLAVIFFYTEKEIKTSLINPYKETKEVGIITKIKNKNIIEEINNKKANEFYNLKDNKNILIESINNPLGIKDKKGELTSIYHPISVTEEGFLELSNPITNNIAIIKMEATTEELIKNIIESIHTLRKNTKKSCGYLLIVSGFIRLNIGEKMIEIYEKLKSELDNTPFLVQFSFGEYGYSDNQTNSTGNLMLSLTSFEK